MLIVHDERDRLLGHEETSGGTGVRTRRFRTLRRRNRRRSGPNRCDSTRSWSARLPARAALDLARALHLLAPRKSILLATRSVVDVGSEALVRAGIADVVRRPIASAELAAALSRSLRSAATLPM